MKKFFSIMLIALPIAMFSFIFLVIEGVVDPEIVHYSYNSLKFSMLVVLVMGGYELTAERV